MQPHHSKSLYSYSCFSIAALEKIIRKCIEIPFEKHIFISNPHGPSTQAKLLSLHKIVCSQLTEAFLHQVFLPDLLARSFLGHKLPLLSSYNVNFPFDCAKYKNNQESRKAL